ncbi:MAG: 50S ribosomal protein L25/general stress protein Ctc [Gammaproteobacteria bacterium]|nr:50S ribosomal protein L25/general stress protein Ctc [Gammaproteobacteria bacterium]
MANTITVRAEFRADLGKAATRRLRRFTGKVPGILYGGDRGPQPLSLEQRDLARVMQDEAFFSQVLELKVDDVGQQAVLRDLQRHPANDKVIHVDFMRVRDDAPLSMRVPLHFLGEDHCVGVRQGGGSLSHNLIEVEISSLPADLPEYIDVDVTDLDVGGSVHLSDITLPPGVTLVALTQGQDHDLPVVSVIPPRGGSGDDEEEMEEVAEEPSDEEDSEED